MYINNLEKYSAHYFRNKTPGCLSGGFQFQNWFLWQLSRLWKGPANHRHLNENMIFNYFVILSSFYKYCAERFQI